MILDLFKLTGKVALVTGARTGLGQGIAVALAEAGADIAGISRGSSGETRDLVEQTGRRFLEIQADVADSKGIPGIMNSVRYAFERIDILVNNAGIIRRSDALQFSEADWDEVLNVNLKALFFFSQAAAREFVRQQSGGKIINIASMLSFQGGVRVAAYTAAKSGVMGVTRILANEWAKHNINVNAIAPGYMATENTRALREDAQRNRAILDRIPAGRWGNPDDVKGAAVFLASAAADYVHGYTLAVDGGWLAR